MSRPALVRFEAKHYVAGAEFVGGYCIRAAPILKWMVGRDSISVRKWLKKAHVKARRIA